LNELNLQFPLRNGTAARIGVINMQGELDPFIARQVGTEISKSPVASRAYLQMQKFGTEVKLDFGNAPKGTFGQFEPNYNKATVFMRNNGTAKEAVSTIVHESSHAKRFFRRIAQNTRYEEYRAFRREFLFEYGKRPTFSERKVIWADI
jgi:hypothetical protein